MNWQTALAPFLLIVCCGAAHPQSLEALTSLSNGQSKRASSANPDWRNSNVDYLPIKKNQTLVLADLKGPGKITHIWMTVLPSEPQYSRTLVLRIYWDGEKKPSVEAPIGDFFGVGHGIDASFESLPVRASSSGRSRSCYWLMPFRKSARITVTNEGSAATWGFYYHVDWSKEQVAANAPYFHAMYRQESPARPGNYLVADIEGRGHYVGTVLSTRPTTDGWWGEGDDLFYVDGETIPSIRGTGMEDYFGEAWGLKLSSGAYCGTSVFEGGHPGARSTSFRWHITDSITFRRSLRFEFEHKGVGRDEKGATSNNIERADDYSSVAFWYQTEPHKPYPPLQFGHYRLSFDYTKLIEGESMIDWAKISGGKLAILKELFLHKGAQLEWDAESSDQTLDLSFFIDKGGSYQLLLLLTCKETSGVFDILVDGIPYATNIDLFSEDFQTWQERCFPYVTLSSGAHKLTLHSKNKNPRSAGYWIGIDGFLWQRKSSETP